MSGWSTFRTVFELDLGNTWDDYNFIFVLIFCLGKFSFHENFASYIEPQDIIKFMETAVEKSKSGHVFVINPRVNGRLDLIDG